MEKIFTKIHQFNRYLWIESRPLTADDFEIGEWQVTDSENWDSRYPGTYVNACISVKPSQAFLEEFEKELKDINVHRNGVRGFFTSSRNEVRDLGFPVTRRVDYRGRRKENQQAYFEEKCRELQAQIDKEGETLLNECLSEIIANWEALLKSMREEYQKGVKSLCCNLSEYDSESLAKDAGTAEMEARAAELESELRLLNVDIRSAKYSALQKDFETREDNWISEMPEEVVEDIARTLEVYAEAPPQERSKVLRRR